jgi:hypothetical protein
MWRRRSSGDLLNGRGTASAAGLAALVEAVEPKLDNRGPYKKRVAA